VRAHTSLLAANSLVLFLDWTRALSPPAEDTLAFVAGIEPPPLLPAMVLHKAVDRGACAGVVMSTVGRGSVSVAAGDRGVGGGEPNA
jgi:hypothetical protein